MDLTEGQQISAPFLNGIARVKKFERKKGFCLLEVVLKGTNEFKTLRISDEQCNVIELIADNIHSLSDSGEDFFFFIEANRIRLAYQFDPLLAVNVSQIDPLPHQIEAVYHYVLENPKIRFLIADDAGAGKTIMAGLVIKELQYRRMAKKILIVAPGHLKYQWQRELKEKFNTNFTIINRGMMDASWGENIWEEKNYCVTSIDFLKQEDIIQTLKAAYWDFVIVDEAHKMSAYGYATKEGAKVDKTQRYRVGEILSQNSTHLLFLTATPHRGDDENFRLFLDLLRPGFFSRTELLKESVESKDNPIFVRRLKEDMKDFNGNRLFPPRHVKTVKFSLTQAETELYNAVTSYVKDYFDRAKDNRNISFAMMILQRRLTSSIYAILKSLENRKKRLETLLELPEKIKDSEYEKIRSISEEDLEEMEEKERWEVEEKLEHLTIAENLDDVKKEIEVLSELIKKAEKVKEEEIESKLVKLRDDILKSLGDKKLLIFTEFRDTLTYLEEKLKNWGYKVNTIHGNMRMDDRIDAEKQFLHNTQIMVATEAAGEGINLQFCSLMVNYDIPWNPNRLEQRMGRIHRYGQDKEVFIYNMISKDTMEGRILDLLFEKLSLMRDALGSDRVFDIIGDVIPDTRLDELMKDAIFNQRRMEEIFEIVEGIDEEKTKQTMERIFMTSLATRHIDYSGIMKQIHEADENRLMPEYIQDYFLRAFMRFGGKAKKIDDYYKIDSVPFELRKFNDEYSFKTNYGKILNNYSRITFDKKTAKKHSDYEYIAPGHPLLEATNQKILGELSGKNNISAFRDETNSREGGLFFIEGEVTDGSGDVAGKRVFCIYRDVKGNIQKVNSSILWDLKPVTGIELEDGIKDILSEKDVVEEYAVTEILFPYREEIEIRRKKDAKIKEKYGLRSINYLLQESNDKLLQYQDKQMQGVDMSMPILNEDRRREDLEKKKELLIKEIRLESQLTVSEPRIIGVAAVIPSEKVSVEVEETSDKGQGNGMVSDEEIEKAGMEVAMTYEQKSEWKVEDVSKENLGFDIRSTKYAADGTFEDIKYIEVKARAMEGAVRVSSNEWKKAKRFKDKFWLYIVTDAGSDSPQIKCIQNPAEELKLDEDIYATGYIIPLESWKAVSGLKVTS
jgi:superfamily II DNA or RNA helicase